jgi:hypothetical protein
VQGEADKNDQRRPKIPDIYERQKYLTTSEQVPVSFNFIAQAVMPSFSACYTSR